MPPTAIEREGCEPRLSKNVADPRGVSVNLLDQGPESRNARSLLWWWTVQGSAGTSKHTEWAMRESWQAEYPAQGCELAHPNICLVFQQLEQEKGTHLQIHNQRIYKTSNNGREVQGAHCWWCDRGQRLGTRWMTHGKQHFQMKVEEVKGETTQQLFGEILLLLFLFPPIFLDLFCWSASIWRFSFRFCFVLEGGWKGSAEVRFMEIEMHDGKTTGINKQKDLVRVCL